LCVKCYNLSGEEVVSLHAASNARIGWLRNVLTERLHMIGTPLRLVDRWAKLLEVEDTLIGLTDRMHA